MSLMIRATSALAVATAFIFGAASGTLAVAAPVECEQWQMRTIAEGLDRVENLEPDGRGGMFIGSGPRRAIERVMPDGRRSTAFPDVPAPGGLRLRGNTLFAVTNSNIADGVTGTPNGKIETFDVRTGERRVYSEGLTFPNGMVFDRDGNAYVSRDAGTISPDDPWVPDLFNGGIGNGMYVTKIPADDPMHPQTTWAALPDTNGLEVDESNTWLYAATTFNLNSSVYRILLSDPSVIEKVADLGGATDPVNGLDDMTFGKDGALYITANGMGRVWRLDPATGESCIIAAGLQNPTAAKFGRGKGWPSDHLFVTGWDGKLRELIPPK